MDLLKLLSTDTYSMVTSLCDLKIDFRSNKVLIEHFSDTDSSQSSSSSSSNHHIVIPNQAITHIFNKQFGNFVQGIVSNVSNCGVQMKVMNNVLNEIAQRKNDYSVAGLKFSVYLPIIRFIEAAFREDVMFHIKQKNLDFFIDNQTLPEFFNLLLPAEQLKEKMNKKDIAQMFDVVQLICKLAFHALAAKDKQKYKHLWPYIDQNTTVETADCAEQ